MERFNMFVHTPGRRRKNALGAPCALCARRRCAVTTFCTPRARHERSATTQSIAGQSCVGALLGNATVAAGAPWHLRVMENVKLFAIFSSIFVRSHGALRNFKSPCKPRGIAVWQGLNYVRHVTLKIQRETSFSNVAEPKSVGYL